MTRDHDPFTSAIEAWLDTNEPAEDPGAVFDHVVRQLDAVPQRRSSWLARRSPVMSNPVRIAVAAAAVIATGVLAVNLMPTTPQPGGGRPSSSATPGTDLGVFEPARGRIVYRVGNHLEAVNPDDPSSLVVIEPGDLGLSTRAMVAGWSADGSKLAITDEYNGDLYVMYRTGSLERVAKTSGCCWFVTEAWMSPDGTTRLVFDFDSRRLQIMDLGDNRPSRVIDVEQFEWAQGGEFQPPMPVWSPDGSQVAYIWSKGGDMATPAVGIIDLTTGASRELISGWGLIRQLTWSPDGSQLLVVAGPNAPGYNPQLNPLVHSQAASLYLVDIDDGEPHEVASGHYVAAAWSPDGTRIAAIDYPLGREVVVINADGSGDRLVVAQLVGGDLFTGVVWHPVPAP